MSNLVCLYRAASMPEEELVAAKKHFRCIENRSKVRKGDLVVGRYSVLPWYNELYQDIQNEGGQLINEPRQHHWIADMDWAFDGTLDEITFPTWRSMVEVPRDQGPFVLKGKTNSKKQQWATHMFARNWDEAQEVESKLMQDGLIGDQGVVIRKFVPLVTYFEAIGGMPITKEFRVFVYKNRVLSIGYYWHAFEGDFAFHVATVPSDTEVPEGFLSEVLYRIDKFGPAPSFYVVDVAQAQDGRWWVVELNDAQMSGLSANDPETLYRNLAEAMQLDQEP
jgi:hypothetical protein